MADTKISDLTSVSTAVSAQELVCNDAGTSKKMSLAQLQTFINPIPATKNDEGTFTVADTGLLRQPDTLTLTGTETGTVAGTGSIQIFDTLNSPPMKGAFQPGSFTLKPG